MSGAAKTILVCVFAEIAVAAVTLVLYGADVKGVAATARATAWVSGAIFAAALAMRTHPAGPRLLLGFAAAHSIHLLAVTYLVSIDPTHFLRHLNVQSVIAVAFGVGLVSAFFLTARGSSRAMLWTNRTFVALGWTAFVIATRGGMTRYPAVSLLFAALLLAMAYHLYRVIGRGRGALAAGTS